MPNSATPMASAMSSVVIKPCGVRSRKSPTGQMPTAWNGLSGWIRLASRLCVVIVDAAGSLRKLTSSSDGVARGRGGGGGGGGGGPQRPGVGRGGRPAGGGGRPNTAGYERGREPYSARVA